MTHSKRLLSVSKLTLSFSIVALFCLTYKSSAYVKKTKTSEITLQSVAEPKDQEVCFSPDEPCDLKLIQLVKSAKESVDIAVYDINRDQLVHELILASKRIQVRVVADKRQAKGNHSLVPLMIKAGVPLKFGHQRGIMHNKFTIVDGRMIETGSFNYTNHATEANNENQIYLSTPNIVSLYKKRFDVLWSNGLPSS